MIMFAVLFLAMTVVSGWLEPSIAQQISGPAQAQREAMVVDRVAEERYETPVLWETTDPILRTCPVVQHYGDLYRRIAATPSELAKIDTQRRADFSRDAELTVVDAYLLHGQKEGAVRFLQERIEKQVGWGLTSGDRWEERQRQLSLKRKLADLSIDVHPSEAERQLQQIVKERMKEHQEDFAGCRRGYLQGGEVWRYCQQEFEQRIASMKADTLGPFYSRTQRYETAQRLYEEAHHSFMEARRRFEKDHPSIAGSNGVYQNGMERYARLAAEAKANINQTQGHKEEAEVYLRRCCDPSAELAYFLIGQQRLNEARKVVTKLQEQVYRAYNDQFGSCGSRGGIITSLGGNRAEDNVYEIGKIDALLDQGVMLGNVLHELGQEDQALTILQRTLILRETIFGPTHPSTLKTLAMLARVTDKKGQRVQGRELWFAWLSRSTTFLTEQLWTVSQEKRLEFVRSDRANTEQFLAALVAHPEPQAAEQTLTLSLGRKGLLARVAGELNVLARSNGDAQTRVLVDKLAQRRRDFATLAWRGGEETPQTAQIRHEMNDLEARLAQTLRAARLPSAGLTPSRIIEWLASNEALIDFLVFHDLDANPETASRENLVAIVARPQEDLHFISLGDLAPMRVALAQYRTAILPGGTGTTEREQLLTSAARLLYRTVWLPLEPHLTEVKHVYVAPDGILNVVPFRALKDEQDHYLVERYQLTQIAAPRDLLAPHQSQSRKNALILGAPDFGTVATTQKIPSQRATTVATNLQGLFFAPLPETRVEAQRVAALVSPSYISEVLLGAQASEEAVKRSGSPGILHLATHGFFLGGKTRLEQVGDPLQALALSGVALANANIAIHGQPAREGEDGILTALEVVSIDLRNTQLVVLSACETGLGRVETGEGVFGLSRGFQEAGARAVLATLWQVDDEATNLFMQNFYQRLMQGESPSRALQATQLHFLQDNRWRDPFFWAPFVLIGL